MKLAEITPVFNYNNALNRYGEAAVHIRIYHRKKRKLIGLDVHVSPNQWDKQRLRVKGHQNKDQFNNRIKNEINRIRDNENRFITLRRTYNIQDIIETFEVFDGESFIEWLKIEIDGRVDLAKKTKEQHDVFYNNLKNYNSDLRFDQLDYNFLIGYEKSLRTYEFTKGGVKKKLELTRVESYLKKLGTYIKRAIKNGLLDERNNPFKQFDWSIYNKANKQASQRRRYLEPDEVKKVESLRFDKKNKYLEKIRDFFIIQCYTGLAYKDMITLKKDQIQHKLTGSKSGLAIRKIREKSGEMLYIPLYLMPTNVEFTLKKYMSAERAFIFDDLTNEYINRELKKIAERAGIVRGITTHTGRHSCAMWLLYNGWDMHMIAKLLGHADVRSTKIYTEINERIVDNLFIGMNNG